MSAPAQVTEAHRVLARHLSTEAESVPHLCDLMAQAIADSEARTIAAAVAPLEARIKSDEELFHDIRMKLTASCGDPYKLHDEALDAIIAERDQLRVDRYYNRKCINRLASATGTLGEKSEKVVEVALSTIDQLRARAERAEASLHAMRLVCGTTDADKFTTWVDRANARAEKAEAAETVALSKWNGALERAMKAEAQLAAEREKSERYRLATLKLDAELATERARLDSGTILLIVAGERVWHCGVDLRSAIDAAMKEGGA